MEGNPQQFDFNHFLFVLVIVYNLCVQISNRSL